MHAGDIVHGNAAPELRMRTHIGAQCELGYGADGDGCTGHDPGIEPIVIHLA